ncbi:unnamed protein product [Boreogadus saida]
MKEGKHERSGPPRVHRGELVRLEPTRSCLEPTRSCLEPTAALVSLNRGAFCSRAPPTLGSRRRRHSSSESDGIEVVRRSDLFQLGTLLHRQSFVPVRPILIHPKPPRGPSRVDQGVFGTPQQS